MWVLLFIQQYPHKKELQNGRKRIHSVLTNSITYHLGCKRLFYIKAYKEKDKGKEFLHYYPWLSEFCFLKEKHFFIALLHLAEELQKSYYVEEKWVLPSGRAATCRMRLHLYNK